MKQLMKLLMIILTGLSLTSCDPPESFEIHYYQMVFKNETNLDIQLTYSYVKSQQIVKDTIFLAPKKKGTLDDLFRNTFDFDSRNKQDIEVRDIEQGIILIFSSTGKHEVELIVDNTLLKNWSGEAGSYGNELNAPYNFDSWAIDKAPMVIRDERIEDLIYYGDIVFTITDKDLE
jgi:hypothetical protein